MKDGYTNEDKDLELHEGGLEYRSDGIKNMKEEIEIIDEIVYYADPHNRQRARKIANRLIEIGQLKI